MEEALNLSKPTKAILELMKLIIGVMVVLHTFACLWYWVNIVAYILGWILFTLNLWQILVEFKRIDRCKLVRRLSSFFLLFGSYYVYCWLWRYHPIKYHNYLC